MTYPALQRRVEAEWGVIAGSAGTVAELSGELRHGPRGVFTQACVQLLFSAMVFAVFVCLLCGPYLLPADFGVLCSGSSGSRVSFQLPEGKSSCQGEGGAHVAHVLLQGGARDDVSLEMSQILFIPSAPCSLTQHFLGSKADQSHPGGQVVLAICGKTEGCKSPSLIPWVRFSQERLVARAQTPTCCVLTLLLVRCLLHCPVPSHQGP